MLQHVGPQPLIEPESLTSEKDWIDAGRRVFEQVDHMHLRTFDPKFVEAARRGESAFPGKDGTARNLRWVPTKDGVALSFPNCSQSPPAANAGRNPLSGALRLLPFPWKRPHGRIHRNHR